MLNEKNNPVSQGFNSNEKPNTNSALNNNIKRDTNSLFYTDNTISKDLSSK